MTGGGETGGRARGGRKEYKRDKRRKRKNIGEKKETEERTKEAQNGETLRAAYKLSLPKLLPAFMTLQGAFNCPSSQLLNRQFPELPVMCSGLKGSIHLI